MPFARPSAPVSSFIVQQRAIQAIGHGMIDVTDVKRLTLSCFVGPNQQCLDSMNTPRRGIPDPEREFQDDGRPECEEEEQRERRGRMAAVSNVRRFCLSSALCGTVCVTATRSESSSASR